MRRGLLVSWIGPAVVVVLVAVYAGGLVFGHGTQPANSRIAAAAPADPESDTDLAPTSQDQLCRLIDRREILELVERPATIKIVETTSDPDGDGHQCTVGLPTRSLRLNVSHGATRLSDYQKLFPGQPLAVLGHPAAWSTGSSTVIDLNLKIKNSTLLVAWDRADSGGVVEISLLRGEPDAGDETTLTRIAERELPALPGWPN